MVEQWKIDSKARRKDSQINSTAQSKHHSTPGIKSIKLELSALFSRVDVRPSGPPGSGLVDDPTLDLWREIRS